MSASRTHSSCSFWAFFSVSIARVFPAAAITGDAIDYPWWEGAGWHHCNSWLCNYISQYPTDRCIIRGVGWRASHFFGAIGGAAVGSVLSSSFSQAHLSYHLFFTTTFFMTTNLAWLIFSRRGFWVGRCGRRNDWGSCEEHSDNTLIQSRRCKLEIC